MKDMKKAAKKPAGKPAKNHPWREAIKTEMAEVKGMKKAAKKRGSR
jgi:hypothetical protein